MKIKYLEWNLHAMGNLQYQMPLFIFDYLKDVDVFVLVEFRIGRDWETIVKKLNDFNLYCSQYSTDNYNQVCIGIRRSLTYKINSVSSSDLCDVNKPEFLKVDINIENKSLTIIGTRIKSQGTKHNKDLQFDFLKKEFNKITRLICLGDFNCTQRTLSNKLSTSVDVFGPRIVNNYHSFVHENGNKSGLDWIISKGVSRVYNDYSDRKISPFATYDWSFINELNGYGRKTKEDYLGINNLPDHAILKGMIEF